MEIHEKSKIIEMFENLEVNSGFTMRAEGFRDRHYKVVRVTPKYFEIDLKFPGELKNIRIRKSDGYIVGGLIDGSPYITERADIKHVFK